MNHVGRLLLVLIVIDHPRAGCVAECVLDGSSWGEGVVAYLVMMGGLRRAQ